MMTVFIPFFQVVQKKPELLHRAKRKIGSGKTTPKPAKYTSSQNDEMGKRLSLKVRGIFQSAAEKWELLDWPNRTESMKFGNQLLAKCHTLFKHLAAHIKEAVLKDQVMELQELVSVVSLLHHLETNSYIDIFDKVLMLQLCPFHLGQHDSLADLREKVLYLIICRLVHKS